MPRPRLHRRIRFWPGVTHFKPAGIQLAELAEVTLTMGEFEAIRLCDLEETSQKEAAKKMKISQPTLQRTLVSARKKIADALANGINKNRRRRRQNGSTKRPWKRAEKRNACWNGQRKNGRRGSRTCWRVRVP